MIKKLDNLIDAKLLELERLKEMMTKINVFDCFKERIQTSPSGDHLSDTIANIIDLEKEINEDIDQFVDIKKECMNMIDRLEDPKSIALLYKRYFEYKTFEQIADEMDLSTRWVIELHKKLMPDERVLH